MANSQNFRSAFNGFNREDVVKYIEYLNGKHSADLNQLNAELERIWAPVQRCGNKDATVSWKEMWGGTTRVMQTCCGEWKDKSVLEFGLFWLNSIAKNEMNQLYARNPHELGRALECATRMRSSEMFLRAAMCKIDKDMAAGIKHEAPNGPPGAMTSPAQQSYDFMFNYFEDGEFKAEFREDKYWLKGDNLPTYLENYHRCRANEGKELV